MRTALRTLLPLVAVAAALPGMAAAATYNNFNGTTGTYGDDLVSLRGAFIRTFTFTLGRAGAITSTIASSSSSAATNIDFTRVQLTGAGLAVPIDYTPLSTGTFELRTAGPVELAAGTYTLDVRGRSGGAASFTGDFTLAGVPEPAAWAMLVLGFGLVGTAARRRKRVPAYA